MSLKVYVDGSYMRRLKNISISYCIVDDNKNIIDEFGLSVGYNDYQEYVEKYGLKFVGLLAMCKTIDKLYKNREAYYDKGIEIYTQNSFVVYALRIMNSSKEVISFLGQWSELYPFLEFIRKRMRFINIVNVNKNNEDKGRELKTLNDDNKIVKNMLQIVMPPVSMRCTS